MPTTTTKNLGLVAALIASTTPPVINKNVVWLDTSKNPPVKMIYNWVLAFWEPLTQAATVAGDNWGSQVVVHSNELSGNGTSAVPLKIAQQGATTGQVLKWSGSAWVPDTDDVGTGISSVVHGNEMDGDGTVAVPLKLKPLSATEDGWVWKWDNAVGNWVAKPESTGPQFEKGMIIMWSGTIANVPASWKLCDGNNGQQVNGVTIPDLRGRFVAGYDATDSDYNAINKIGGNSSQTLSVAQLPAHTHGVSDPGHAHTMNFGLDEGGNRFGSDWLKNSGSSTTKNTSTNPTGISIQSTGSGAAFDNRPNYFVLAFIIKV